MASFSRHDKFPHGAVQLAKTELLSQSINKQYIALRPCLQKNPSCVVIRVNNYFCKIELSFHKSLQIFRTHNLIHLLVSNFCTFVGNLLKNCLANSAAPDKNQEKNHKCFRLVIVLVIVNIRNLCVFQRRDPILMSMLSNYPQVPQLIFLQTQALES